MTHTQRAAGSRARRLSGTMLVGAAAVVMAGCPDSNVGFLTAPTSIPTTQTGLQQAIAGLFSFTRNDQFQAALEMSAYAREASNFTSTEPRFIEYDLGINPIPVGAWISFWADAQKFTHIHPTSWTSASLFSFLVAGGVTWALTPVLRRRAA